MGVFLWARYPCAILLLTAGENLENLSRRSLFAAGEKAQRDRRNLVFSMWDSKNLVGSVKPCAANSSSGVSLLSPRRRLQGYLVEANRGWGVQRPQGLSRDGW